MDHSRGLKLYNGAPPKQYDHRPKQGKSRSGQEFLGLFRCAACYNHNASSMHLRGGNRESSSSSEDSELETDCESESENSSTSSCLEHNVAAASEKLETERPSPVYGEPECGVEGDGREEKGDASKSLEDESSLQGMSRRTPFVKSLSLPLSLTPHLTPLSLLPRSPRIVSTLHLQVLHKKHDNDTSFTIRQHVFEKEDVNTDLHNGRGEERILNTPQAFQNQQIGFPWQQRSQPRLEQHHFQHELPQHYIPLTAPGKILPPPLHTFPALDPLTPHTLLQAPNALQTHVHTLFPQPCWCCYQMQFPYTYLSHYSSGHQVRW
ncbi:uncharacterized protein [Channa argus]|uniref:uncharacterized protein n=1 Tax=Channa argus TaxID=215402 RepID=UPI003521ADAD